ncbi:glycosyltransferase [Neptuniibacter pectenicola]|uniref:Glycosyltransferase n=1 Tax=Neptuniibacter pectenicola TaxID=1806669 RepID=A0ABU9TVZ7_9GAMM
MIVNHVMSNDVQSGIFDSIMGYFKVYSPDVEYVVSIKPINDADVYHYHRPHLESSLMPGSTATVHHDLKDTDSWLDPNRFYDRYKECEYVICLNTGQEKILNELGIKNTVVIPHGYRSDLFNLLPKAQHEGRKFRLAVISKRYGRKVKGEAYLYEIMKRLDPESIEWLFVGEGRSVEAKRARDLGFDVKLYERLPYRVFGSLYESIDALVMCSWHEGGPANIPEALASGTPVIGFNVGMVKDAVRNGVNGAILTGNPDVDERIFISLFKEEKNILKLQSNFFSESYSSPLLTWQQCIHKNVDVYRQILKSGEGNS